MSDRPRAGRAWTWAVWEREPSKRRRDYASASKASAGLFVALLALAMTIKHVAPTPAELSDSPLASARRVAASETFRLAYLPDCEQAALAAIEEPYRTLASKLGAYEPAAFSQALACLDAKLGEAGLAPLQSQLMSGADSALLTLDCAGELRDSEVCARAFSLAANRGRKLGKVLAAVLSRAAPAERRPKA